MLTNQPRTSSRQIYHQTTTAYKRGISGNRNNNNQIIYVHNTMFDIKIKRVRENFKTMDSVCSLNYRYMNWYRLSISKCVPIVLYKCEVFSSPEPFNYIMKIIILFLPS